MSYTIVRLGLLWAAINSQGKFGNTNYLRKRDLIEAAERAGAFIMNDVILMKK